MGILCLHGCQNNSKIIGCQGKFLRSIINLEYIFPNAPNLSLEKPKNINSKLFPPPSLLALVQ